MGPAQGLDFVLEVAKEENVLPEDELSQLLDPRSMTEPNL